MEHQSKYDPSRQTVGAMYLKAQKDGKDDYVEVGDMRRELTSSLVDDLNDVIKSNPYNDRPYYITIHEAKDLTMPHMLKRRMLTTLYRPYPEDDTVTFYTDPKRNETLFCWCLPHWSEMDNMLNNEDLQDSDQMVYIKAWKGMNMEHFGFMKDPIGNWIPNPHYIDKPMQEKKLKILVA